jgi:hypothetical protein
LIPGGPISHHDPIQRPTVPDASDLLIVRRRFGCGGDGSVISRRSVVQRRRTNTVWAAIALSIGTPASASSPSGSCTGFGVSEKGVTEETAISTGMLLAAAGVMKAVGRHLGAPALKR